MKVTRNIDTGDEKQTIRTISTKPKEHFEGRWKSGRLYPLYSVVVNNGTTFISQNAKMKEEPYVIYDADKKVFKAPDGWLIKEMSADSRVTALGGGGGSAPGESAGFGEVTVEVDNTSGTPRATVTADGPDTAKNFHFAFSGLKGTNGTNGTNGQNGQPGQNGANGKSAYDIWIDEGHEGYEEDFLEWLKGDNGAAAVEYGATLEGAPSDPLCHLQLTPGSLPSGMSGWTFGKADLYLTLQNYSSTDDDSYYSGVFANPAAIEVSEGDDPNSGVDPGSGNSGEEPYEEDDYSIENGGVAEDESSGGQNAGDEDSAHSLVVWARWHNDGWECGFYEIRSSAQDAVKYTSQSLTAEQKTQARKNIGAQETLVGSGTGQNIKTINEQSILGEGDITIANGDDGVGFESIETPQAADGTIEITLTNGDTIILDLNHVHPQYYSKAVETSQPQGGFLPDVIYKLGTLTGSVTFALAAAVTGNVNHYFWMFDTGSTAPTITWPAGLTWAAGSAPTVAASKHYEISVLDGIAYYSEV